MKNSPFLFLLLLCLIACEAQNAANKAFADVFKPLDGKWKGQFIVYRDSLGQREANSQPRDIDKAYLDKLPLIEELRIDVEQIYTSESPYYQRVQIKDTYKEANGTTQTVESTGFNEVKKGKLRCVVNKPDEKVVHKGSTKPENVIIWERSLKNPTKIEYFYETVDEQFYSIIGWGYYGNDDPKLSPKTWFYAKYKRVE